MLNIFDAKTVISIEISYHYMGSKGLFASLDRFKSLIGEPYERS